MNRACRLLGDRRGDHASDLGDHVGRNTHRKANCWDNAVAESFFSSLKKERIKKQIYKNRALATKDVADYIDTFYNPIRRHSHLGGVSPEQYESGLDPIS